MYWYILFSVIRICAKTIYLFKYAAVLSKTCHFCLPLFSFFIYLYHYENVLFIFLPQCGSTIQQNHSNLTSSARIFERVTRKSLCSVRDWSWKHNETMRVFNMLRCRINDMEALRVERTHALIVFLAWVIL